MISTGRSFPTPKYVPLRTRSDRAKRTPPAKKRFRVGFCQPIERARLPDNRTVLKNIPAGFNNASCVDVSS